MSLVYSADNDPDADDIGGVHVLIVAVAHYHIVANQAASLPIELREIEAELPAIFNSGQAIAQWLETSYDGPTPLKSITFLSNQAAQGPAEYQTPNGSMIDLVEPNLEEIKTHARAWHETLNENPLNSGMFFFLGHGFQQGASLGLAADFGRDPQDPLRHSVALDTFVSRMKSCQAGLQSFFFDCCRENLDVLGAYMQLSQFPGDPLLGPLMATKDFQPDQPVIFATLPSKQAFAKRNDSTLFAKALLKMVSHGVNATKKGGKWVIRFGDILEAIKDLMAELAEDGAPPQFPNARPNIKEDRIFVHIKGTPLVRCEISSKPKKAFRGATIELGNGQDSRKKKKNDPGTSWEIEVPASIYQMEATFPAESGYQALSEELWVLPTDRNFVLEVAKNV